MSSLAPERMRDAPVTVTTAKLATPKPSPLQRLAVGEYHRVRRQLTEHGSDA